MKKVSLLAVSMLLLASCVSKKKFAAMNADRMRAESALEKLRSEMKDCDEARTDLKNRLTASEGKLKSQETDLSTLRGRNKDLEDQLAFMKTTNTNLLERLSDLSIVSKAGAESIKKSLDALDEQSKYIKDLTSSMQRKDSLNLTLVMNLKRSLSDVNDQDVNVQVKKGVVYISLSDDLLFKSGSAVINSRAEAILAKIAQILNDQKELDILIEGHTDNVPIATDCYTDNWDLSAKRATSIVRFLQRKYGVSPERMTAGGRSEYVPIASNDTSAGRGKNRRTEIIILPKLDQFFELMTQGEASGK